MPLGPFFSLIKLRRARVTETSARVTHCNTFLCLLQKILNPTSCEEFRTPEWCPSSDSERSEQLQSQSRDGCLDFSRSVPVKLVEPSDGRSQSGAGLLLRWAFRPSRHVVDEEPSRSRLGFLRGLVLGVLFGLALRLQSLSFLYHPNKLLRSKLTIFLNSRFKLRADLYFLGGVVRNLFSLTLKFYHPC